MSYAIQIQRLASAPLAVIRRQASASELKRVVPECCGLVWNALRAQQVRGGRHVAIYWDASIRLEVGVEISGPFVEDGNVVSSATPAGVVASATHYGPYGGLGAVHDVFCTGARPGVISSRVRAGRSTVTGRKSGMPIRREFARTSTTCWQTNRASSAAGACPIPSASPRGPPYRRWPFRGRLRLGAPSGGRWRARSHAGSSRAPP